jgi:secretion/DNA translocation related TadE-like protein
MSRRGRVDGSATIWVLMVVMTLVLACGAALATGTAVRLRHRAAAAADAAALAAAIEAGGSPATACAAAARTAADDQAQVVTCALVDGIATVSTRVPAPGWLAWLGSARGQARAGQIPADAVESP